MSFICFLFLYNNLKLVIDVTSIATCEIFIQVMVLFKVQVPDVYFQSRT